VARFQARILAVLLAACVPPRSTGVRAELPTNNPKSESGSLGSGDMLEVRVFQEADLSGIFRVSGEGTIVYPLCGKVMLAELTASAAGDALTECLKAGFMKKPQVTVLVREYTSKKVFVFGEVNKPGTFPWEDNMSIIQVITLAGGFTKQASRNNTNVTRLVNGTETKMKVPVEEIGIGREKNFVMQPGDIIFVPESFF
jgi:protein involved in polysaccharide export with SLBB domain